MSAALKSKLHLQIPATKKKLIEKAAVACGQDIGQFAVDALVDAAQRVLEQNSVTVLSDRDRDIFLAMLDADDPPNEALRKAAKRYKEKYGSMAD